MAYMKKALTILSIALICITVVAGCSKDDDPLKSTSNKGFAPSNIVGKIYSQGSSSFKVSRFTSTGTCSVTLIQTGFGTTTITNTPTYTYKKTDANHAVLTYTYDCRMKLNGITTNYVSASDNILTFTSSTEGTYDSKAYSNGAYFAYGSGIFTIQ